MLRALATAVLAFVLTVVAGSPAAAQVSEDGILREADLPIGHRGMERALLRDNEPPRTDRLRRGRSVRQPGRTARHHAGAPFAGARSGLHRYELEQAAWTCYCSSAAHVSWLLATGSPRLRQVQDPA